MALILIVDDALLSRKMISRILKKEGHSFIEAKDGEEALSKIKEKQPDCVCLDLLIPKISGLEVLAKLQEMKCSIPVIMITADTQETTSERALNLGAIAVLNKPAKAKELNEFINKAISNE